MANMIYVAAKEGGGTDPAINVRLATIMENAAKMSIPKKVIEGAIARAAKAAGGAADNSQSISYEGVGPGGVAFVVEALTENRNRTAQQVRAAFLKFKGSLSPTKYLFSRRGWIELITDDVDGVFDKVLDIPGVEDIEEDEEGGILIYTDPARLSSCAQAVRQHYKIDDMGLAFVADASQSITGIDEETLTRVRKLEAELEDLDDVNNVYNNLA